MGMKKYLIQFRARTPVGKQMVNHRRMEASSPEEALSMFHAQGVKNEGVIYVWECVRDLSRPDKRMT